MNKSKVQVNARLPEAERRRLRILAVQRGLNMEQALLQAVQVWIATAKPGELPRIAPRLRAPQQRPAARGPRAQQNAVGETPATKSHPSAKPGPDSSAKAPSAPASRGGAAAPPDLQVLLRQAEKLGLDTEAISAAWTGATSRKPSAPRNQPQGDTADWPQRALALDWSQCPAAEMIQAKRGQVWVFRGTRRPLWDLFHNMQRGYSVDALMKHFADLKDEQVAAVLQFAGQRMFIPDL